jgi:integrase/recombinase XerD
MQSTAYKNEQLKRSFYRYLTNAKRFSPVSVRCFEKAIWIWEDFSEVTDFTTFNESKVIKFKDWLKSKNKKSGTGKVSLSYCYDNLRYLKVFFEWLSKQNGYRSKIDPTAIEYMNLTKAETREATQPKNPQSPSLLEVKTVIESIKDSSEIEKRDKALISLALLTGARISALTSLPIKSFDRQRLILDQNPKLGVKTKFNKRIVSAFIPLSYDKPKEYFLNWFDYLVNQKGFKPSDPIFPATKLESGTENLGYYSNGEVGADFWKSTTATRNIFTKRFIAAGIPYYHPHTFRHLLVKEISKLPLTEEQKKAFSQNLGHEDVGTTFGNYGYGKIDENKQIEIINKISFNNEGNAGDLTKAQILKLIDSRLPD